MQAGRLWPTPASWPGGPDRWWHCLIMMVNEPASYKACRCSPKKCAECIPRRFCEKVIRLFGTKLYMLRVGEASEIPENQASWCHYRTPSVLFIFSWGALVLNWNPSINSIHWDGQSLDCGLHTRIRAWTTGTMYDTVMTSKELRAYALRKKSKFLNLCGLSRPGLASFCPLFSGADFYFFRK